MHLHTPYVSLYGVRDNDPPTLVQSYRQITLDTFGVLLLNEEMTAEAGGDMVVFTQRFKGTVSFCEQHVVLPEVTAPRQPPELTEQRIALLPKLPLTWKLARALVSTFHKPDTSTCPVCYGTFTDVFTAAVEKAVKESAKPAKSKPSDEVMAALLLPEVALMPCGHVACVACMREWLPVTPSCPVCRLKLKTLPETEATSTATAASPAAAAAAQAAAPPTTDAANKNSAVAPTFPLPQWWVDAAGGDLDSSIMSLAVPSAADRAERARAAREVTRLPDGHLPFRRVPPINRNDRAALQARKKLQPLEQQFCLAEDAREKLRRCAGRCQDNTSPARSARMNAADREEKEEDVAADVPMESVEAASTQAEAARTVHPRRRHEKRKSDRRHRRRSMTPVFSRWKGFK